MKFSIIYAFLAITAFALPVGAQVNISPVQSTPTAKRVVAQQNVTVIYNIATGQPMMVAIDANNLATDPSYNPPGSAQLSIPISTYNAFTSPTDLNTYLQNSIPSPAQAAGGS